MDGEYMDCGYLDLRKITLNSMEEVFGTPDEDDEIL